MRSVTVPNIVEVIGKIDRKFQVDIIRQERIYTLIGMCNQNMRLLRKHSFNLSHDPNYGSEL